MREQTAEQQELDKTANGQPQEPEPSRDATVRAGQVMSEVESDALNLAIGDLDAADGFSAHPMARHGKNLPYIGWFWRTVDFTAPVFALGDCGAFVGFMENNKWDYGYADPTAAECAGIVAALRDAIAAPGDATLQRVYDLCQRVTR